MPEEHRVWLCLFLLFAIAWMLFIPSKQMRTQHRKDWELEQKRKARVNHRSVSEVIGITGIMAHRGNSTTFITNLVPQIVQFVGIAKGYFSDTVFIVVDAKGDVKQYATETLAQNAYREGYYGITAVTMSDGVVTTRHIVPEVLHEKNAFKLQYNFVVNPK